MVSEDKVEKYSLEKSKNTNNQNKLSEEKSSLASIIDSSDLSELEKFLLDELKAIDITNRI